MRSAIEITHGFQSCNVTNSFCGRMPLLKQSCCVEAPLLRLVMTHSWHSDPPDGPTEKWSLKTLWDGLRQGGCGGGRQVGDVSSVLDSQGLDDVLAQMHLTWTSPDVSGPQMWSNEWNNHGACVSSLRPACYEDHTAGREVGDFAATVISLSNSRPTFEWLFNSGVAPTFYDQYDVGSVARALENGHGAPVTVQCTAMGFLKSVQYFFELEGCFQYGRFRPVSPFAGWNEGCGGQGVSYHPKQSVPQDEQEQMVQGKKEHRPPVKANGFTIGPRGLTGSLSEPTAAPHSS